ncbi:EthD domain-containing protein [Roseovarius sp. EL26]|uniref:EthD domain-containing protein n=1 Tax=Roseovarius sp. EL26 TaxID=2126672 RepID=UPI000EA125DC|nr:EthD domain-containing protein [Roseovarius sp. EL26]
MIKLIMCLRRRADISRAEFQDYWLNKHGPFFQENAGVMRSKRYVQSHTIDSPLNDAMKSSRNMQPEFDGVAEVWFTSEDDLIEAMGSAEMQELSAALLQDEANFIDHEQSSAFIVQEHAL